jgi:hypothetical protein
MSQPDSECSGFINEDSNQSYAENSNMGFSQEQEDSNESDNRSTDVRLGEVKIKLVIYCQHGLQHAYETNFRLNT